MPGLFDTFTIKSVTLRNRIGVSPMCQYVSNDGTASDWHLVHLGARAVGGTGLVIAEATAVEPRGRISPQDAGLWSDKHIEPLARITRFVKEQGAVPGIQLAHAGRKASAARPWEGDNSLKEEEGGWPTIAPSAVAFGDKLWKVPEAMTHQDIKNVQQSFVAATKMALTIGYQWLELHAAHGYLCHSFYSPISNKRTDEYGGSFENRIRFTVETLECMRAVWPENLPLAVRLSCSDWVDGGWTIEETIELAKKLKQTGADLIDCSSGFGSPDHRKYPFGPGWQVPFSEAIKREAQIATAAVGMITDPIQANEIIESGKADIVLLAREMLRDPYWPQHAAKALGHDPKSIVPSPYLRWI
ncbi:MAG: NADH:flavin oxidoreductase/NADH oxidase [Desulfomonilaceae bacterium]|jgi:2,4-dienoyl-CoA reductase-like NADH-dependent reductase (Old Yellow Enzyme family)